MLATTADVQRYLDATMTVAAITPILEAAQEWVKEATGRDFDQDGPQTKDFFSIRQGDILTLPDLYPVVTGVKVFLMPDDPGRSLTEPEFSVMEKGRIALAYAAFGNVNPNLLPETWRLRDRTLRDGVASVDRPPEARYYKVTVNYQPSGIVPALVREATAMIAAANLASAKAELGPVKSESMGDYSYTLRSASDTQGLVIPPRALDYLAPFVGSSKHWPGGRAPGSQVVF